MRRYVRHVGSSTYTRTPAGRAAAGELVGRRVVWDDADEIAGTVVGTTTSRNGYPRLVVQWDAGAPEWWASIISPSSSLLLVEVDS